MLEHFKALLETLLQFITHITSVVNMCADKSTAKFWRAQQHKVHDLLDKVGVQSITKLHVRSIKRYRILRE